MESLFNDEKSPVEQSIISENTPEDNALHFASKIFPTKANTIYKVQSIQAERLTYTKSDLIKLAKSINPDLQEDDICEFGKTCCEDYNVANLEDIDFTSIWFDSDQIRKFLKWCEPKEKTLFD